MVLTARSAERTTATAPAHTADSSRPAPSPGPVSPVAAVPDAPRTAHGTTATTAARMGAAAGRSTPVPPLLLRSAPSTTGLLAFAA